MKHRLFTVWLAAFVATALASQARANGLDSNYYYGDFLVIEQRAKEARPYLERVLQASARPGRELADQRRRAKVKTLMKSLPTR